MGNQPSKKATRYKGSKKNSPELIKSFKESYKENNVEQSAKIAIGGGLEIAGNSILSTSLFAACKAYSEYKKTTSDNVTKIASDSVLSTIKNNKSLISKDGHSSLKSSISIALGSVKKT